MQWPIKVQGRFVVHSEVTWIKQPMLENLKMVRTGLSVTAGLARSYANTNTQTQKKTTFGRDKFP